jgi:ubiquinone/menaquinone biosynthesis C-methylase UbiE
MGEYGMVKLQRRFKDLGIGGIVAYWYDNNTRKNRLEEMKEYTKEAAKYLHNGSSVLEVAPGPGYLTIELAKIGKYNKIIGLDISKDFVEIAQRNANEAGKVKEIDDKAKACFITAHKYIMNH